MSYYNMLNAYRYLSSHHSIDIILTYCLALRYIIASSNEQSYIYFFCIGFRVSFNIPFLVRHKSIQVQ